MLSTKILPAWTSGANGRWFCSWPVYKKQLNRIGKKQVPDRFCCTNKSQYATHYKKFDPSDGVVLQQIDKVCLRSNRTIWSDDRAHTIKIRSIWLDAIKSYDAAVPWVARFRHEHHIKISVFSQKIVWEANISRTVRSIHFK